MTTIPQITKDCRTQMEKSLDASKRELASIRTGKATTNLLDTIRVDAYGQQMPINQVGSVAVPEPFLFGTIVGRRWLTWLRLSRWSSRW